MYVNVNQVTGNIICQVPALLQKFASRNGLVFPFGSLAFAVSGWSRFKIFPEYLFKHIRRKAVLCEFKVGAGTLMMASLNMNNNDPAATALFRQLANYLAHDRSYDAPSVEPDVLRGLIDRQTRSFDLASTDCALDPNGA